MSAAQDHITKESLELISTESFAMNLANFRSLLLSYEKEVQSAPVDGKRSALILKEVTMLQEIIGEQISRAGPNARSLGVPPEELEEIFAIYRRTLGLLAINYASKYDFLFNSALDEYLAYVEQWPAATELHRTFAGQLKMARATMSQLFRAPDAASLISPALVGLIGRLTDLWPQVLDTLPLGINLSSGAPPKPPQLPPVASEGGPGDNGKMEYRINKLESAAEQLQKDVTEIKGDVKDFRRETKAEFSEFRREVKAEFSEFRREAKAEFTAVRSDMRTDFRLLFGATIAVALGLAGMMAKGFGWF
jgi:hypothetical protein